VQHALNVEGIFPRRYFYPSLNTLKYVRSQACEISEVVATRVLCLPLYSELGIGEQDKVVKIILKHV
jgi:dTDP-4-amino-4,6-dideoxygalactose transaminase